MCNYASMLQTQRQMGPGVQGGQFQGEFGPISGGLQTKSFLHSYSSSFGLLRQA